jgi:hypothetical protein
MATMTEQFKAAFIRAFYGAMILTGGEFCGLLATADSWRLIASICGGTFFGYMALRGMSEGLIDSNRAPTSADVGQPKP